MGDRETVEATFKLDIEGFPDEYTLQLPIDAFSSWLKSQTEQKDIPEKDTHMNKNEILRKADEAVAAAKRKREEAFDARVDVKVREARMIQALNEGYDSW